MRIIYILPIFLILSFFAQGMQKDVLYSDHLAQFKTMLSSKHYQKAEELLKNNKTFVPENYELEHSLILLKRAPWDKHASILNELSHRAFSSYGLLDTLSIFSHVCDADISVLTQYVKQKPLIQYVKNAFSGQYLAEYIADLSLEKQQLLIGVGLGKIHTKASSDKVSV